MRHQIWVGLGLSTCLTAPAAAERWYQIATTDTTIELADADSVRTNHGITGVTLFRGFDDDTAPFAKADLQLNCASNQFRVVKVETFNSSRKSLEVSSDELAWDPIADNSIAHSVRQFACDGALRDTAVSDPFVAAEEYFYYYYY